MIICPKCKQEKPCTNHHQFPKRFYKQTRKKIVLIELCWSCHCELETYIPQREKMPDSFYAKIVELFLSVPNYKPVL